MLRAVSLPGLATGAVLFPRLNERGRGPLRLIALGQVGAALFVLLGTVLVLDRHVVPPMSPTTIRNASGFAPNTAPSRSRAPVGVWFCVNSVVRPPSKTPIAQRGSSALAIRRRVGSPSSPRVRAGAGRTEGGPRGARLSPPRVRHRGPR